MMLKHISLINRYEKLVAIGFSTPQLFLLGISGWLFAYSVVQDISQLIFSPLAINRLMIAPILSAYMAGLFVLPIFALILLMKRIHMQKREEFGYWRALIKTLGSCLLCQVLFCCAFLSLLVFIFLDMWVVISESCLSVVATTAFMIFLLKNLLPHLNKRRRYIIIASLALFLITVRYTAWNASKPFLRDLHKVTRGMSGVAVENLLAKYQKNRDPNEIDYLYLEPAYTGESYFRFTDGNDFGWGKINFNNGRVINVEFIPAD
jgi:hypothetical protein